MKWDKEADIVIVGVGGAGVSAAITAHELGAKVIALEKQPEGGGNTRYSGGSIRTFADKKKAIRHYHLLCESTTPKDVIAAFVEEASQTPDWMQKHGVDLEYIGDIGATHLPRAYGLSAFPSVPGAEGIGVRLFLAKQPGGLGAGGKFLAGGSNLFGTLSRQMTDLGVEVLYNHPARRLVFDNKNGVTGVEAEGPGGKIRVKARRGVILSCGGFEANADMHWNYLGARYYPMGTEANTGDGIKMAGEVGADLWHMNAVANTFGYKVPEYETVFRHEMGLLSPGYIYVDQNGCRFMDEAGVDVHAMWTVISQVNYHTGTMPRLPCYLIFDEDTRRGGPIAEQIRTRASDSYHWSDDNLAEAEKGWITRADTLPELAEKLKLDSLKLQETLSRYNIACVGGFDPDFRRASHTLVPVVRAPFYGIALWPALMNTQGGPRHDARSQILNTQGKPIKRLYAAGECGSLWGRLYPGGGNVSEAIATGRIAARNAFAETPWD